MFLSWRRRVAAVRRTEPKKGEGRKGVDVEGTRLRAARKRKLTILTIDQELKT